MSLVAVDRLAKTSDHLRFESANMAAPIHDQPTTVAVPAVDNEIRGRLALVTGASGG